MDNLALSALLIAGSYLLGSVPTAYWLAKALRGIDIRKYGSGNVGISNFAVHVSRKWAVLVVLVDVIVKGTTPVLVASPKILDLGIETEVAAAAAAITGHNWSVFLGFTGGRGMATVLGATGALSFPLVILYGAVPALGMLFSPWKDSAVWWAVAALLLPIWSVVLRLDPAVTLFCVGFILIIALKRLTSDIKKTRNYTDYDQPLSRLIFNRLVFDRDISSREEWVRRRPTG